MPTESQPQRPSAHPGALTINQLLLVYARKAWVWIDTLRARPARTWWLDQCARGFRCGARSAPTGRTSALHGYTPFCHDEVKSLVERGFVTEGQALRIEASLNRPAMEMLVRAMVVYEGTTVEAQVSGHLRRAPEQETFGRNDTRR